MDATCCTYHARYYGQDCLNPFTTTREIAHCAEEETKTDDIVNNLPDDSADGLEQDNEDGGDPEDPILAYLDEWE